MKTKPTKEQALDWLEGRDVVIFPDENKTSLEIMSHLDKTIENFEEPSLYECICKAMGYEE